MWGEYSTLDKPDSVKIGVVVPDYKNMYKFIKGLKDLGSLNSYIRSLNKDYVNQCFVYNDEYETILKSLHTDKFNKAVDLIKGSE